MFAQVEFVDQVWWYTSRAAGIVSWVLLTASVLAGMSMASRDSRRLPRGWPIDLHRFLSTLSLVFLAVHMAALVPDNFVEFGWAEIFVPMASTWQPGAVAWGVVGFWLVVAVEISSLLKRRIPNRVWRTIHFASFGVWISATVHLFMAGTDVSTPAFRVVQVVLIVAVVLAFIRRAAIGYERRLSARRGALPVEEPIHIDQVDAGKR